MDDFQMHSTRCVFFFSFSSPIFLCVWHVCASMHKATVSQTEMVFWNLHIHTYNITHRVSSLSPRSPICSDTFCAWVPMLSWTAFSFENFRKMYTHSKLIYSYYSLFLNNFFSIYLPMHMEATNTHRHMLTDTLVLVPHARWNTHTHIVAYLVWNSAHHIWIWFVFDLSLFAYEAKKNTMGSRTGKSQTHILADLHISRYCLCVCVSCMFVDCFHSLLQKCNILSYKRYVSHRTYVFGVVISE